MAHAQRYLKRASLLLLGVTLGLADGFAQTGTPPADPQPLLFRAVAIGSAIPLSGLFYEHKGKSLMVYPSDVSLSPTFERSDTGPLKMYREVAPTPPETKPKRVPALTANLGPDALYLLALTVAADNSVACTVIDDSWEAFPLQMVRVLNFSHRNVVVQVEGALAELAPQQTHLFPYSKNRPRIRCKVASKESDGWKLQFENSQAIIQGTRVNIMISDCEPTVDDPNPDGINVLKMIDPLQPPKPDK
jgi:hypothetical protein